ncbi:MAG: hypothetical protein HYZ52_07385 [Candidatus Omnitrophica bacterium]|nr:hypothetical protein [Candidatus Omnitrophota bacterium]
MSLSFSNIFSGIVFGAIGFSAFLYGKRQGEWRPMVIGAALIGFPYLVANTAAQVLIGALLTAALFVLR